MNSPGGYIILGCVLLQLVLQIVALVRADRTSKRIEGLEQRVTRIELAFTDGKVDHASVTSFRAELAERFTREMSPVHRHLADQDKKLDEIRSTLKDWLETRDK